VGKNLDILFVIVPLGNVYGVVEAASVPEFNLGVGYLVAVCREKGFAADCVDMGAEGCTLDALTDRIRRDKPAIVGITAVTVTMDPAIQLARTIKEMDESILVVVGGPHPTALPERTLADGPFDAVVRGEGERTIVRILERHLSGGSLAGIPGITHKIDGKVVSEPPTELIQNLDELPFPYRNADTVHLYKNQIYFDDPEAVSYNLIATRGCPYRCIFCGQSIIFPRKVRARSAENVFAEMRDAHERLGIRYFFFEDSTFVFTRKLVEKLCNLVIDSGLDFKWGAMGRLDLVNEEFYGLMRKAGCSFLHFGVESGNDEILVKIRKKFTVEQALKSVEIVRRIGIPFNTSFILGFPWDTEETIRQTIDLAKRMNSDYVSFSLATPYPGTEFHDMVTAQGWSVERWSEYEQSRYNNPIYVPPALTHSALCSLLQRAYREFYFRPRYMLKHLRTISNWRQFASHVRTGLSLLRKGAQKSA